MSVVRFVQNFSHRSRHLGVVNPSLFTSLPLLLLIETHSRQIPDPVQIDLVPEQLTNVRDTVLHHGRALKGQTETVDAHVFGQTHGLQHLRSEHAGVTDLNPLLEALVVPEDLHTRLRG